MTYTELLTHLIENSLNYDPNAKCGYNASTIGHTTEKCCGLKHKVQDLMDARLLSFEEKDPNIGSNLLPNHGSH
ncbi:hypothetical protein CR513_09132, partial [Mucuna pruriens]